MKRRAFLQTSAALAATALSYQRILGANDRLLVGCIGTGGRCRFLMKSLVTIPSVRIAAVCDIWEVSLQEGRKLADSDAFTTKSFPELLERKDIDAVLIGSPDHWHVPMTIAACEAKKDVYVEKPLTHNLEEGQAVIDAQNKHRRIVQVGTQQRSMTHIQKAYEFLKAGRLGKINKVRMSWNRNTDRLKREPLNIDPKSLDWKAFLGNAKDQPFDAYRFRNWRWFWDFGGGLLTDLMVHWIDVAYWFLALDHPLEAVTIGTHTVSKGIWETPDTIQTILLYPNDLQLHFEGTFSNARAGAMIEFMGSDATLYIDRGRYELQPERGKGKPEEMVLGTGPKGKDFYDKPDGELLHLTNWIDCIRSRQKPNAPVEAGVAAAAAAHLGNQAFRTNAVAMWKK
ncbi:MAG TPA: Gfo/Idh/MocA family oxidoreductase [Gemmataceae bacterium]|jgi:predicted dehydrogenase|nr:Gfo/Idh/MocA family oxidoreductase [Gemmataceae bacterium]